MSHDITCKIDIIEDMPKYHSLDSCCNIIKNCQKDKLKTPLEETFPDLFGKFDTDQTLLIKTGAKPLILIENASEIISQLKNIYGFIEQIINLIISDNKTKYISLGSHTFPKVLKEKWVQNDLSYYIPYGSNPESQEYDKLLQEIKPKKIPKQALLHMAVDLDGVGHYGIAIKNNNKVIVFDSMQVNGYSAYSQNFLQFAYDVFEINPKTLFSPSESTCPQLTGGFVDKIKGERKKDYLVRIQDMNSQNHFCYFWAIWYFHIFILYGEKGLNSIFDNICSPPLCVIKRYIWSIIHSMYPSDEKLTELFSELFPKKDVHFFLSFFVINFRYIWDNFPEKDKFRSFSIMDCDLSKVRSMTNLNDCLEYSMEKIPFVLIE